MSSNNRSLRHRGLVVITALLLSAAAIGGQQPTTTPQVKVTAGRSTIINPDFDVTRIAVTNPAVADATVVLPREILIDGKSPGTISLIGRPASTASSAPMLAGVASCSAAYTAAALAASGRPRHSGRHPATNGCVRLT